MVIAIPCQIGGSATDGGGAGSHSYRQPAMVEDPSAQQMAALPGYDYRGAKYFVGADGSNWSPSVPKYLHLLTL
jgi:hypothetical protein